MPKLLVSYLSSGTWIFFAAEFCAAAAIVYGMNIQADKAPSAASIALSSLTITLLTLSVLFVRRLFFHEQVPPLGFSEIFPNLFILSALTLFFSILSLGNDADKLNLGFTFSISLLFASVFSTIISFFISIHS